MFKLNDGSIFYTIEIHFVISVNILLLGSWNLQLICLHVTSLKRRQIFARKMFPAELSFNRFLICSIYIHVMFIHLSLIDIHYFFWRISICDVTSFDSAVQWLIGFLMKQKYMYNKNICRFSLATLQSHLLKEFGNSKESWFMEKHFSF